MGFIDRLRPRAEDFFGPLEAMAESAAANAVALRDLLTDPSKSTSLVPRIRERRMALDEISDALSTRLSLVFIAPIDAEDIVKLNAHLHDLGDAIDDDARLFVAMKVEGGRPHAVALCEHLIAATEQVTAAIHSLKRSAIVQHATERIHEIEREADSEYHSAISELFRGAPDPIEVLKWNDVYNRLEELVDMVHHTGNLLDRIAIKDV